MKSLKGSKTYQNLMAAFSGECQAAMKYKYYEEEARKDEKYIQIANVFAETATNEEQHAKRFYKFLMEEFNDQFITVPNGEYLMGFTRDTKENLMLAIEGEHEENNKLYPSFANIAEAEGYKEVAEVFRNIATVEAKHEERYKKLYNNFVEGKLFKRDKKVLWKCNNCGFIYEGTEAPKECPACAHPQGFYEVLGEIN